MREIPIVELLAHLGFEPAYLTRLVEQYDYAGPA